jgi:hypothetical protein
MKTQIFYGGWILTLLATLAAIYGDKVTSEKLVIALFFIFCAVCTFLLLRNPTFPKREAGLATSWMGPLLLAISMIVYVYYFNRTFQTLSNQTSPTEASLKSMDNMLITGIFLGGCLNAALAYWVEFGHGFVLISALGVILFPDKSERIERDIQKYPPRWGWLVVIMALIPSWFFGFTFIQSNKDFDREINHDRIEAKLMIQKVHKNRSGCKRPKSAC